MLRNIFNFVLKNFQRTALWFIALGGLGITGWAAIASWKLNNINTPAALVGSVIFAVMSVSCLFAAGMAAALLYGDRSD